MSRYEEIIKSLPLMLSGDNLYNDMKILPKYDPSITSKSQTERLIALSDIYKIYIPFQMSYEIYSKLYLALLRSLQKKCSDLVMEQQRANYDTMHYNSYSGGIIGGTDSFSILGNSGIGKSATINRCTSIMTKTPVIEASNPYSKIIPCLLVQCPFDSSVKGLMLEILRKVDDIIGTKYYEHSLRNRATTDMLIGCVSQVALNNIGLLIIDEIQNVCNSKNGKILVGSITQLVNNSGISTCFVGTPDCKDFFSKAPHLARRTIGLQYKQLPYDKEFTILCEIIFKYQYMPNKIEINDAIIKWLYNHSNGNIANVISLFHDAQELGIINCEKSLSISLLKTIYDDRMELVHTHSSRKEIKYSDSKKQKMTYERKNININTNNINETIRDIVDKSKQQDINIVKILKEKDLIIEVRI